jgi:acyl-CoA synthetase (AMP-forming)/AMP-acid ligase II
MSHWGVPPRILDRACQYYRDDTALIAGDTRITYLHLGEWTNRIGNGLVSLGVREGDRVGLLMPNCVEYFPTQYGIWKAGAVQVQMPARASADDHRFFLNAADATTLIYHADFEQTVAKLRDSCPSVRRFIRVGTAKSHIDALDYADVFDGQPTAAPEIQLSPGDLSFITFTSGTTGQPKGVLNTHESWSHYIATAGLEIADTRPREVFAHGAPLTHFTQAFFLPTLMRGGTNVIMPGLDVETIFSTIDRYRVTATAVVPTVVYLMVDHPRRQQADLSSLRTIVYAGSPMSPDRLQAAIKAFGPIFVQSYAGTEPGFMTCLRKEDHRIDGPADRLGSAGRAMFHVDLSIRDEQHNLLPAGTVGEICCRQEGRMVGYLDPALDAEGLRDGWVHSGDLGYLDDDGFLFVVDRKKDMVVTGGFNVFPRQVEDVLLEHGGVAQCAVIGVPDPKWGEAVKAVVVPKPGVQVGPDELVAWVKHRKGSVWAPKSVDFVTSLPTNANGKVDKKRLRAPYWRGRSRQVN